MEINWLDILLKGVPIVVSIGALFISTKVWLLNKKNISVINQPRFKIFRMYDPTNGLPDTYTFALNIEGNAPFYINEVEWISKDNHKVITDQYQDRLEIMNTRNSETKPHIVQYIKVKVQNSSKAVIRGTLTIKYVDAFGKERKVESPELFLNKNKISNSKYLYYKYFV